MKPTTRQKALYYSSSLLITFIFTRLLLFISPATNLYIGEYNVHHLYLGSLVLVISFILQMFNYSSLLLFVFSGIGTALVLDELIFLIVTDGSDHGYLSAISLWGAVLFVVAALLMIIFLSLRRRSL